MKKKTLSGLIVFLFSSIAFSTIANADYKILTSEELESISLGALKKEYQLLADEYSTLLNSSSIQQMIVMILISLLQALR